MQDLLIMETVDVRRADDPDDSKVLTITKFVMPKLQRETASHKPGGGIGSVDFTLPMVKALEPSFSVKGLDLDVIRGFGFTPGQRDKWTFAATLRNTDTNAILPVRFAIRGIIAEWNPADHSPGEVSDCDHVFKEVTYADLFIDNEEIFVWDWKGRTARSGGVDWFKPYKDALGA